MGSSYKQRLGLQSSLLITLLILQQNLTSCEEAGITGISPSSNNQGVTSGFRQGRTTLKELNMQNLPSCMSMVMCRMGGSDSNSESTTKNQALIQKLMETLMNHQEAETSDEESEERSTEIIKHSMKSESRNDLSKPSSLESFDNALHEEDNQILKRRGGQKYKIQKFSSRNPRVFGFNPWMKSKDFQLFPMKKAPFRPTPSDLMTMKNMLQDPVFRSSRQCNSRLLRITWIRSKYPPNNFTASGNPGIATQMSQTPGMLSGQSCPYNFPELQKMIFDTMLGLLMTAGGFAELAQMLRPKDMEKQPMKKNPMEAMMTQLQGQDLVKNAANPNTVYANFKLPVTFSTDQNQIQNSDPVGNIEAKVTKLHAQNNPVVPIPVALADFFRKRGGIFKFKNTTKASPLKSDTIQKNPKPTVLKNIGSEESDESDESKEEEYVRINYDKLQRRQAESPNLGKVSYHFRHWIQNLQKSFTTFQAKVYGSLNLNHKIIIGRNRKAPQNLEIAEKFQHKTHYYGIEDGSSEDSDED